MSKPDMNFLMSTYRGPRVGENQSEPGHTSVPPAPKVCGSVFLDGQTEKTCARRPGHTGPHSPYMDSPTPPAPAATQLWPATKGEQAGYDAVVKASAAQETAKQWWHENATKFHWC